MSNKTESNEFSHPPEVRLNEMEDRLGSSIDSLDHKDDLKTDSLSKAIDKRGNAVIRKIEDPVVAQEKITSMQVAKVHKLLSTMLQEHKIQANKNRNSFILSAIVLGALIAGIGWFLSSNSHSNENSRTFIVQQENVKICSVIYFDTDGQWKCLHCQSEGN